MTEVNVTENDRVDSGASTRVAASSDVPKKDVIRDNAPRIVGAMKFVPDIFLFLSGLKDTGNTYFRSAAAVGFMTSRSLLLRYGTKDRNQAALASDMPDKNDESLAGKFRYNLHKVMHPSQFPVEAGAGVAALAGVAVTLSGAAQMRNKKTFWEGVLELGIGVLTTLAEGNVLFKKEKPAENTAVEQKKSSGIIQKLKDQPVLLSGLTQIVASGSQIGLGVMTLLRTRKESGSKRNKGWFYLAAGTIYTVADLIYAFMVRKNEFNGEQKNSQEPKAIKTEVKAPKVTPVHTETPISNVQAANHIGIVQAPNAMLNSGIAI